MDLLALILTVLFVWFIIRVFGAVFRGPRWRRRQARKNYDYADWLMSRRAMRQARRDRW